MPREDDEPRRKKPRREDDDEEKPRARKSRQDDEVDDLDDAPPAKRRAPSKKKGDGFATLVPFRNKFALFAYYFGIFGLIPVVNFVFGPIAMILGIIGLFKARKHPKAHGTGHAIAGIVLGFIDPLVWIFLWYFVFEKMTKPEGS